MKFSDWAAPAVPVLKANRSIHLCGDYKVTVNKAAKKDTYPLPRIEDSFAALSGGRVFSKLDLTNAYQQIQLEEELKTYMVFNTHKGLFRYERLPYLESHWLLQYSREQWIACYRTYPMSVCTWMISS